LPQPKAVAIRNGTNPENLVCRYEHHKHGHHHREEYQPEVVYVQPGESDLGMGLSGGLRREGYGGGYSEGYGAGYGANQPGYAAPAAYGQGGYQSVSENSQITILNPRSSSPNNEFSFILQSL